MSDIERQAGDSTTKSNKPRRGRSKKNETTSVPLPPPLPTLVITDENFKIQKANLKPPSQIKLRIGSTKSADANRKVKDNDNQQVKSVTHSFKIDAKKGLGTYSTENS